jgi:hypothetical protein
VKSAEQIAAVEWMDAFGCPAGWEFEDEARISATIVRSIGYVLKDDDQFVMLAPHISTPGDDERRQLAGHIAIPRRSIVAMEIISPSSRVSCPVPASAPTRPTSLPQLSNSSAVALCLQARRFLQTIFRS